MKVAAVAEFFAVATIELNNCSFGGNSQSTMPLIVLEAVNNEGKVTLRGRNSIFYNPDAAAVEMLAALENSDTTIDLDYCFLGETNCAAITKAGTTVTCGSNMFYNTAPHFADPSRGTLLPTLGAPTIDEGDPATATSTDYRGESRPLLAGPDIGAYEFPGLHQPVLTVRVDAERKMVLEWSCLTGEIYTLRRTRNFVDFEDFVTGYPSGGAKSWNLEFISNSVDIPSIPHLFYQVERE